MISASQVVGVELGDLSLDGENERTLVEDDEEPLPRKRMHRSVVLTESEDEPDDCDLTRTSSLETVGSGDPTGNKRPKAADWGREVQSVIQTAIEIYYATLLGNDPYPPPIKEVEWARAAWQKATYHHQTNFLLDLRRLKVVSTCHRRPY